MYKSNYLTFLKRQNYGESKKICGFQRAQGDRKRLNMSSTRNCVGNIAIEYDTVMVDK